MAETGIGFKDSAFGPFVPGIDEYQTPSRRHMTQALVHRVVQPVAVATRRRVKQHAAASRAARFVVPARVDTWIQRIVRQWCTAHLCRQLTPVAHVAFVIGIEQELRGVQLAWGGNIRWELHCGIEADVAGVRAFETLHVGQMDLADAIVTAPATPARRRSLGVGQQLRPVQQQHRSSLDLQRTRVAQVIGNVGDERQIILGTVLLADQYVLVAPIPAPGPVLVGPTQAERQLDRAVGQPLPQRPLHQRVAAEPVEVEAESADAMVCSEFGLRPQRLANTKVIEAQVAGQAWLYMALELGQGAADISPFSEALAPPGIVLFERMELGQIEGHQRSWQRGRQWRVIFGGVADRPFIGALQWTGTVGSGADATTRRRGTPAANAIQAPVAQPITQRRRHRQGTEQCAQDREGELADAGRRVAHGWNLGKRGGA